MGMRNLWGELPGVEGFLVPAAILREQAAKLGELTDNILEGKVVQSQTPDGRLIYELQIVAPALHHYRYTLLRVVHGVSVYPLTVCAYAGGGGWEMDEEYTCRNEEEFIGTLESLLSSDEARRTVGWLLAQSKALT